MATLRARLPGWLRNHATSALARLRDPRQLDVQTRAALSEAVVALVRDMDGKAGAS